MIRKIIMLSFVALTSSLAMDNTKEAELKKFAKYFILHEMKNTTAQVNLDIEFSKNKKKVCFIISKKSFEASGEYEQFMQGQEVQNVTIDSSSDQMMSEFQTKEDALRILEIAKRKLSNKPAYKSMVNSLIKKLKE